MSISQISTPGPRTSRLCRFRCRTLGSVERNLFVNPPNPQTSVRSCCVFEKQLMYVLWNRAEYDGASIEFLMLQNNTSAPHMAGNGRWIGMTTASLAQTACTRTCAKIFWRCSYFNMYIYYVGTTCSASSVDSCPFILLSWSYRKQLRQMIESVCRLSGYP